MPELPRVNVGIDKKTALGSLAFAVVAYGAVRAPLAVSAQGPETTTPSPTATATGEDLCIIDGDVWEGTISMNNTQDSGEPDVAGMQVELTGSNGISKEDTTLSNGRYYFSDLPRNGVYSLNFGGIVQRVVDLVREAHGKAVCFKNYM
jgi:hypothetical protein